MQRQQLIMNSTSSFKTAALVRLLALKRGCAKKQQHKRILPIKKRIKYKALPPARAMTSTVTSGDAVEESPVRFLRSMFPDDEQHINSHHRRTPPYYYRKATTRRDSGDGFHADAARAIRTNDIDLLRKLMQDDNMTGTLSSSIFLQSNRNGESLLHLACRRGNIGTIQFLVNETNIPLDVRDNLGRTVLHDACWRPRPDTDIMNVLFDVVPPQLLIAKDARGHTPFDYVRRGDWKLWNDYLQRRREPIEFKVHTMASLQVEEDEVR